MLLLLYQLPDRVLEVGFDLRMFDLLPVDSSSYCGPLVHMNRIFMDGVGVELLLSIHFV